MAERNNVCAVLGCTERAKWIVNITNDSLLLEVPICAGHEPQVAPYARDVTPPPTTPAPEQAGEGERCPHACIDEHEQPTDESCPFSKPCPVHDAREVRRG